MKVSKSDVDFAKESKEACEEFYEQNKADFILYYKNYGMELFYSYVSLKANNFLRTMYVIEKILIHFNEKPKISLKYYMYLKLLKTFGEDFITSMPGDWEIID